MQTRAVAIILVLFLASAMYAEAGMVTSRKMLQYRYRRDSGSVQLARNQAALVNTQFAIQDAVESGANPRVTQDAAFYGNYQAWQAAQRPNYWRPQWWGYGK